MAPSIDTLNNANIVTYTVRRGDDLPRLYVAVEVSSAGYAMWAGEETMRFWGEGMTLAGLREALNYCTITQAAVRRVLAKTRAAA